ncbi:DUF3817 domain-containing protein [Orrella sp. JC864]|uniref:DUF3817 domain-containing protein n=1 Tax=Orrella sp. JC864 TaxID=3120298 RepID=UPI00300BBD00
MMPAAGHAEEVARLRRMRHVSLLEGTTLLLLVLVAVPLKHLWGMPQATAVMGPVHGMAFLLYVWMLVQTVSAGGWPRKQVLCMLAAALVPFGAFVNERALARRQKALAA